MAECHPRIENAIVTLCVLALSVRYALVRRRLKGVLGIRKLRVLFLLSEHSKWKSQTLYDAMLRSDIFDPYVCPTVMDTGFVAEEFQHVKLQRCIEDFKRLNVQMLTVCRLQDAIPESLRCHRPDIVIYQQPHGIAECQSPMEVSKYALTAYLPYYIIVGDGGIGSYATQPFLRMLYIQFFENAKWANYIASVVPRTMIHGLYVPVGCPFREEIELRRNCTQEENCIIYAPHWSFKHPNNPKHLQMGTFLENGIVILEYAKAHPEIHWIFKPHPVLKDRLVKCGVMTVYEVDKYYKEWASLGEVCQNGDYIDLFYRSRAMLTDCGSFLNEYTIVNKPLIRMVQTPDVECMPPGRIVHEALYEVHTNEELLLTLKMVVEDSQDPKAEMRQRVRQELGFDRNDISKKFIRTLELIIRHGRNYSKYK